MLVRGDGGFVVGERWYLPIFKTEKEAVSGYDVIEGNVKTSCPD